MGNHKAALHVNAFFSHDEHIDFFAKRDGSLVDVRKALGTDR
jgi:hypothetical protein